MDSFKQIAYMIIDEFSLKGDCVDCKRFGGGHINNTYLLELNDCSKENRKFIVQEVNTNVFKNIYGVMNNIALVTEHLKGKISDGEKLVDFLKAKDGKIYYIDSDNKFWRVYEFIDNSACFDLPESADDFYQCALAFGRFQKHLDDFPADTLIETIVDFHNTPKRYEAFLKAVEEDKAGRAASVAEEIAFVKSESDFYSVLFDNHKAGKLPLRVSHNDTKCNNVLLDSSTRKALCVIDLDTIMPGFSVTDFGDSIRFGAATASEDEKDLSKVLLDMEKFEIYTKGFLDGSGGLFSDSEIMLLPVGAKMMTIECGMRFLTDYLDGDNYFKTAYPTHNLDRCRTQFKLVTEMEKHWDEMNACVAKYTSNK